MVQRGPSSYPFRGYAAARARFAYRNPFCPCVSCPDLKRAESSYVEETCRIKSRAVMGTSTADIAGAFACVSLPLDRGGALASWAVLRSGLRGVCTSLVGENGVALPVSTATLS